MFYSFSTLKVIFLFFTLLTVKKTLKTQRLLEEKQEPEYIPKSCDNRFLKFFLMNPELTKSVKPQGEMNHLCPQVEDSCCSSNDFNSLLQQILEKQFAVGKTKLEIMDLVNSIVNFSDQEINDVVQIVHQKNCIKPDNIPLLMARSKLKKNVSKVHNNLNDAFNYFFKLSTSFTCSLCEHSNEKDFIMNEMNSGFKMQVNKNICNYIFLEGFQNNKLQIFEYLEYLNVFVEMLGCVANDELSLKPVLFKEKYSSMEEKGLYCSTENNWIENEECNRLCTNYSMVNQNIFSDIMVPIEKSKRYFADLAKEYSESVSKIVQSNGQQLMNKLSLDNESITQLANTEIKLEKMPEVFDFKYFIEAIGGEKENPNVMKVELVANKGINPIDFHMTLVSEGVNRLFTFVILSLLVFFIRE
jgi:hypothetical protein